MRITPLFFFIFLCLPPYNPFLQADEQSEEQSEEETPVPFFTESIFDYSLSGTAIVTESVTTDVSVYENGAYIEHLRKSDQGRITLTLQNVSGRYYLTESIIRNTRPMGTHVKESAVFSFPFSLPESRWNEQKSFYPIMKPYPRLPKPPLIPGTTWKVITVFRLGHKGGGYGGVVSVPITYRYDGTGTIGGKEVHIVSGRLLLEYAHFLTGSVISAEGEHQLSIAFSTETELPYFMKDRLDESFVFSVGNTIGYKGFVNHWFSYPDIENDNSTELVRSKIEEIEKIEGGDIKFVETPEGPTLRLGSLNFYPDTSLLLPGQEGLFREIKTAIETDTEGKFLVTGHTAATGNPEGEKQLSLERARTVSEKLIKAGINPERILYEGRGSSEPISDNKTTEEMAKNRRVEIILLDY